jgi:hypothetical protein
MTTSMRATGYADERHLGEMTRLPRISDAATTAGRDGGEPNPMFSLLVETETDVVGLLAYGLYKQNKRDWLIAHQARAGREPTLAELDAFILGERIPRRVITYRRLAQDMLASDDAVAAAPRPGLLDGLMASPANDARPHAARAAAPKPPITWRYIGLLLVMLVAMAVIFRLAAGWLFGTGR